MQANRIRVLLADDHAIVRVGVRAVLESANDIEIIGEATGGREAVTMTEQLAPDVVVMDLSMGEMGGAEATAEIVEKGLPTRILVLTMHAEEEYLVPLLKSGAAGYLLKSAADHDLVEAVRVVARGDLYVPPSAARVLAKGVAQVDPIQQDRDQFAKLTTREQDVLRLIAAGYNAPEIGEQLFISAKTVDTYKQRINEKLGFTHRSDFVKLALKLGLISP
jgi:DNA-binding NarL/FixJ family response regulator